MSSEKDKINIYGELHNDTPGGYVTTSEQIIDEELQKSQEEINKDIYKYSDYSQLSNKPKINNVELDGNLNTSDLGINIPTKTSDLINDSGFLENETEPAFNSSPAKGITSTDIDTWNGKQATLISGTNIKTINNQDILGSGNININTTKYDTLYLVCDSEANAVNKVILTGAEGYELSKRIRLLIKMTNTNTAQEITLSINNTDPKPLWYGEIPVSSDNTWEAGDVIDVYYDGTVYQSYPTNQPKIRLVGNILIISGKQFALTTIAYYYIGWANMSRQDFRNLTENQVKELLLDTKYNTSANPVYSSTFGNNSLFILAYKSKYNIEEILFTSGGQTMSQDLLTDNTAEHDDITIDGEVYHIWGISHPEYAEFDPTDNIKIIFR